MRALREDGEAVRPAKSGPDYIDPAFHAAAAGAQSVNLDAWAMSPAQLRGLAARHAGNGLLVVEGAMGLYDGAANGGGSTAGLARTLDLPVVLVVDASRQSQSVAALVHGFATFADAPAIRGVILNRVGSPRHEGMLRRALEAVEMPVLGAVPRDERLALPQRHLGLVQAGERGDLAEFIATAARLVGDGVDLDAIRDVCADVRQAPAPRFGQPPGDRVAVARDVAFSFTYPHLLDAWSEAGSEVTFFSPLADEAPDERSDFVFLPGGYPELHAGRLAGNTAFLDGLRRAARQGVGMHGECGGYMVLGEGLIDAQGARHAMAGLLPVVTSFAEPRRTLGYRRWRSPAAENGWMRGHEHHRCVAVREETEPLHMPFDALGDSLPGQGACVGTVSGSWLHAVAPEEPA